MHARRILPPPLTRWRWPYVLAMACAAGKGQSAACSSNTTGERNMPERADARALAPGTPGTTPKSKHVSAQTCAGARDA